LFLGERPTGSCHRSRRGFKQEALPSPACFRMKAPIRELPRTEVSRVLVYVTSISCGVLAAIAVQILLRRAGIELGDMWRNILTAQALQLRSAGGGWLMLGAAFVVGAVVAAVLSRLPLPWHRFRLLRWVMGAALVFAMAEVGHVASVAGGPGNGAHAAATLATLCAAALVAMFGAYFASRR
jgi:hypothetical protein